MNALKALVAAMGVLIVIGIGLVGYGLMRGKAKPDPRPAGIAATGAPVEAGLPLPHGAKLDQVAATSDRIILRLSGPEGDKLLVVDPNSGALVTTISLVPDTH